MITIHISVIIISDYKIGASLTHVQLKDLLIQLGLINIEDQNNNDLILGELTHASMILEDTENTDPDEFGNILQEEIEGQKTACSRNFDEIAKVLHNIPSIDDTIVVKEGEFRQNIGIVKKHNEDGTISVSFETALYTGNLEQQLVEGNEYEIDTEQNGKTLKGIAKYIDNQIYVVFTNILLKFNYSNLHI